MRYTLAHGEWVTLFFSPSLQVSLALLVFLVYYSPMPYEPPPTTDELLHAYMRAQVWRIGMTFHRALSIATVRWALEKTALARRHTQAHPQQLHLRF
jgi:hypothetical protein